MKNPFFTKILSGAIHVLVGYLIVATGVFRTDASSEIDTYAFIYWTLPLALGFAAFSKTLLYIIRRGTILKRLVFIALISILISIGWENIIIKLLGPLNGTFDQAVVYTWSVSIFCQLLFLEWRLPKETEKREISGIVLGFLSFPMTIVVVMLGLNLVTVVTQYASGSAKETYLIPSDFEGEFRVVYGEKHGQNPPVENGRRVLRIPKNGILVIQPEYKEGKIDHEYYLVDKKGNRKQIKIIEKYNERMALAPGVLYWGWGSTGIEKSGSSKSQIQYTDFTLYRKDTKERNNEEYIVFQRQFDSLTKVSVLESRAK